MRVCMCENMLGGRVVGTEHRHPLSCCVPRPSRCPQVAVTLVSVASLSLLTYEMQGTVRRRPLLDEAEGEPDAEHLTVLAVTDGVRCAQCA